MYPYTVELFGTRITVWNATLLLAVVLGYPVLLLSFRLRQTGRLPRYLVIRWVITVYMSAVAAQLFAYFFDLNTSALPPPFVHWTRYYLNPLFGPKTLYGVIVFLPLTVFVISTPWRDLDYRAALDCWTPPLFAVLGIARVGCFLQGCCYGVPSTLFGVSFPPRGSLYYSQLRDGLITPGARTLPVVPTQAIEAAALFALCAGSLWALKRNRRFVVLHAVATYSVFRFLIEFVRDDPDRNFLGLLSTSQWVALVVLGVYAAWRRMARA